MTDSGKFIDRCKQLVLAYELERMDKANSIVITADNVFVVWSCKTLQNQKALLSTTLFNGMYYEITSNGDAGELYFDAYRRTDVLNYDV